MKLQFETFYKTCIVILMALIVWTVWAAEPSSTATNTVAPSSASTGKDGASKTINLPVMTFGLDEVEWLQPVFLGTPRWKYVASLLYLVLAILVARLIDFATHAWLKKIVTRTRTQFDDVLIGLVGGPVKIVSFVILLHIGLSLFDWPDKVEVYLSKGMLLVVAASLTYVALKVVDILFGFWKTRLATEADRAFNEQLFPILNKCLKVFIVIVAVLMTTQNLGLNITSLIASLSIGGLALGLAAQDTVANLFGAIAIFLDKPFRIGDHIKLDAVDGTVEAIGLRSTRVRNLDGHLITIPNKTMGNATITNISRRPTIKTEMNFGLTYDTPTEKVKQVLGILEEVYRSHPLTTDLIISFNKFADSALNIFVVHWWSGTDQKAYLLGMQELNLKIKQRFDEAGIEFAFPSQTHYVRQVTK